MIAAIILAIVTIPASEAWECEGTEIYADGSCQEADYFEDISGPASYDTESASYVDDGQCFDVPSQCWADGQDTE